MRGESERAPTDDDGVRGEDDSRDELVTTARRRADDGGVCRTRESMRTVARSAITVKSRDADSAAASSPPRVLVSM